MPDWLRKNFMMLSENSEILLTSKSNGNRSVIDNNSRAPFSASLTSSVPCERIVGPMAAKMPTTTPIEPNNVVKAASAGGNFAAFSNFATGASKDVTRIARIAGKIARQAKYTRTNARANAATEMINRHAQAAIVLPSRAQMTERSTSSTTTAGGVVIVVSHTVDYNLPGQIGLSTYNRAQQSPHKNAPVSTGALSRLRNQQPAISS